MELARRGDSGSQESRQACRSEDDRYNLTRERDERRRREGQCRGRPLSLVLLGSGATRVGLRLRERTWIGAVACMGQSSPSQHAIRTAGLDLPSSALDHPAAGQRKDTEERCRGVGARPTCPRMSEQD